MFSSKVSEVALAFPFRIDAQGNVAKTNSQELIWANRVRGAVGTIQGQRLLRSTYGTGISAAYMDTINEMSTAIEEEIVRVFNAEFPTLTLDTVQVEFKEEANVLDVDIQYQLPNQQSTQTKVGLAYINKNDIIQEVNL
jgi:hypothetical protein